METDGGRVDFHSFLPQELPVVLTNLYLGIKPGPETQELRSVSFSHC